ncbi:hypothetical protein [Marinobacter sp. Arc7-DN-1]|uniref:hypothetical protein n=1 Tax=Marinobacter sp. Arc7-DN-1 TaxID=2304594 RepID=UPI000E432D24|nr:hypothetical protein [Marinobacter sp. Arc7-DN-1]AXS81901.1 hypothetical protein D0851_01895 [Marinobacter sp. Arc7-DN-1]
MKLHSAILGLSILIAPQALFAKEAPFQYRDANLLVQSCQEAVDVFSSHEKTGYLAAYRTSLSEALRAGYCIGVLEQFSDAYEEYCEGDAGWFENAKRIASLTLTQRESATTTTFEILEEYACGY